MNDKEIALELVKLKYKNINLDNLTYYEDKIIETYKKFLKVVKDE
jgi:hypothetical protein